MLVASSAVVLSDLAVLTIDGGRDSGELEAALASSIVVPDAFVVVAADLVDIIDDCDDGKLIEHDLVDRFDFRICCM